jgi:hypothetical protein
MRRDGIRLAIVSVCLSAASLVIRQDRVESATFLFSHWNLNEGGSTTTVDSVAPRSGTLRNGARWVTGISGMAVAMDGVDDHITLPALEVTGETFSIAVWVRNTSFPTGVSQRFVSKASDSTEQGTYWMLGQTNSSGQNLLRFRLKAGGRTETLTASSGNIPLNTWYHAVATYDGSRMRLYLNGTQVAMKMKTGSVSSGSGVSVNIGRSPDGSGYLRGAIDDLRIYRSALTASEVVQVMAAGSSGTANRPPTVSLGSPADGASFAAGTTVGVSASASDADGTVSRVVFYAGSTRIGSVTSRPYRISWPRVAVGSYTLKAVATDNAGAVTESATRTVTVLSSSTPLNRPPSVSLTSPASDATFTAPAAITLSADASDTDGSITRVDFYRGTSLIGSDTSRPYSVAWTDVAAGSYSLTAVARDNAGATTVSSTREITVTSPSLPTTLVFTPSSNHATAVDWYELKIFPAGADTRVANAVATRNLGKPSASSGECIVDVTSTIFGLSAGNYVATVSAVGDGGTTQSAPSPRFTR